MSEENVEVVRRLFEVFRKGMESGDLSPWFDSEDLAEDFEWRLDPGAPGLGMHATYRGRDGFLDFMRTWTENFDRWSIRLERVIDAGEDRVVGVFHQRAIGRGSGVPIELHMALVYELEHGRVIRMWNYLDPAEALEAAGVEE